MSEKSYGWTLLRYAAAMLVLAFYVAAYASQTSEDGE